jgi:hypothetical protein
MNTDGYGTQLPAPIQILTSPDGVTWSTLGDLPDSRQLFDIARVRGEVIVAYATVDDDLVISRLGPDGWRTTGTPNLVQSAIGAPGTDWASKVSITDRGIAVGLAWVPAPPEGTLRRLEHDYYTLTIDWQTLEQAVLDANGQTLWNNSTVEPGTLTDRVSGRVDGGISVLDDQGATVDTFTAAEIESARIPMPPGSTYVALSIDLGATWSVASMTEVLGTYAGDFERVTVLPDGSVLAAVLIEQPDGRQTRHTIRGAP